MRRCQMFTVSARFVTVILPRLYILNARWEVTYIKLFYCHWIIHGNKYIAVRTCFLASFNGVMSAAMQRGAFRVLNIYCHAKIMWSGMLIIHYTFMHVICFCYFREVSCFDKKGQKCLKLCRLGVWRYGCKNPRSLNLGSRWRWVVSLTVQFFYAPEIASLYPSCKKVRDPGPFWT